jgi:sortase A
MSVITGGKRQVADSRLPVSPPWRVPDLCREFVEVLVARARAIAGRTTYGSDVPDVAWDSIRSAGDGASSVEEATGTIVTAAFVAARQIAGGVDQLFGEVDVRVGDPVAVDLDTAAERRQVAPDVPHSVEVPARPAVVASSAGYTFFTWLFNLGAVLLLFVAWQLWGTAISQHHAQAQLQSAFEASVHEHHTAPVTGAGPVLIPANQVVTPPTEGSPVAHLQIPAIGLDEYVVSGTAEGDLAKGPGHYIGTAMPGQAGNVAVAGHRTTNGAPFNRIGQLAVGNPIYLTTLSGERLTYVVSQPPAAVSPSDVAVLNDFGDNRITLTTCNPEFSASQRLIVVGRLKQPNPPKASKAKPVTYHIVNPATASWDWSSLPVVVLEVGVLLLLGLSNRWFTAWFGRSGRWMILVPIWAAGLYLLFSTLTKFLPASI